MNKKNIFLIIATAISLPVIFIIFHNPFSGNKTIIIGSDKDGIIWGKYANKEYGISFEFPYADELKAYSLGKSKSSLYSDAIGESEFIGLGAIYDKKLKAFEPIPDYSLPGMDPRTWRTGFSVNTVPFKTIQEFVSYKLPGDPYSRQILEESLQVDGQNIVLVSNYSGEFDQNHPRRPVIKPEDPGYRSSAYFVYRGRLYGVHSNLLASAQFNRVIKSIRLIKED